VLVLVRKRGESIMIGDSIRIQVQKIGRNRVVLAVDAPKELLVLRDELLKRNNLTPEPPGAVAPDNLNP
jgi:carbon storage regulator